jgi:hypothetical protein
MKFFQVLLLLVSTGLLASCGIAAKVQSRNDMMDSKTKYKACLERNSANPDQCKGLRLAYEADMKAYKATSAGIRQGYTKTVDVNVNTESSE